MTQDLQQKWSNFVEIRSKFKEEDAEYIKARNALMDLYYPLVHKVAERMHKKIKEVDIDNLTSWGVDGLFHAVERFDPDLKNKFETFAIHRIRGSILDNIRKVDWVPRLVRQRYSMIQKKKHELECNLGRCPNDEEVAQALKMSIEEYTEIASKANPLTCVSIFGSGSKTSNQNDGGDHIAQIEDSSSKSKHPLGNMLKEEMFKKLLGKNFVPLERKIIHLHYYQNLTMKEIAQETGYSESRISQMHAKILERLQKKIHLNPEYMADLEATLQS